MKAWLACLLLALSAWSPAHAHKPSDSYLSISVSDAAISGQWDIALRDLDFAIGLDADGNGEITWGEVRAKHAEIAAYALARLAVRGDGAPCAITPGAQQIDDHTDGAYTVLPLAIRCAKTPAQLAIDYSLFADIDPQHRGLLNLQALGITRTAVLGPQAPTQTFELKAVSRWRQFIDYAREGVWHIWVGFDHILFLLSLLLPAVLLWRGRQVPHWLPAETFRQAFVDVFKIVTAFTLAHSITLSLATLGFVSLPSRWVESAIAASVVLAALNNVVPVFHGRRWMVAFGFGLIHGFGFASVLTDLGLPREALALALVGFNLGVEGGQLAIVSVFLPLAFALRRTAFYRRAVMVGGSLVIVALAGIWLAERLFNFKLLPF
jgi:HupE / UreJ protein